MKIINESVNVRIPSLKELRDNIKQKTKALSKSTRSAVAAGILTVGSKIMPASPTRRGTRSMKALSK
jgi:hypothetical protein